MKAPSGIAGLDLLTKGGLPKGRLTVVSGAPGLGKTILSLQFLASGGEEGSSPGIFVAFEDIAGDIVESAAVFGWVAEPAEATLNGSGSPSARIIVLKANPKIDELQAGDFDLGGLLAVLSGLLAGTGSRRVAFDGIDVVLDLLSGAGARRREILRLRDWVLANDVTAIVTSKPIVHDATGASGYDFLHYIASALICLRRRLCGHVVSTSIEVAKLRGSDHLTAPYPFFIDRRGFVIGDLGRETMTYSAPSEHISSGITSLDGMLGGGYLRGSSILVSGAPGTAKTTLSGSFASAACARKERALYLSFDEVPAQIVRNLRSVGIDLDSGLSSGLLTMAGLRIGRLGPEEQFQRILDFVTQHDPHVAVIDPISALNPVVDDEIGGSLAERIIDLMKARGVTVLLTSLLEGPSLTDEKARARVSSVADTWMHLSFAIRAGERNRALTIIKSRGAPHSNQVRELLLSSEGVSLAEVYSAEGEVLMGSARIEKEERDKAALTASDTAFEEARAEIEYAEAVALAQLEVVKAEIEALGLKRAIMEDAKATRDRERIRVHAARILSRQTRS